MKKTTKAMLFIVMVMVFAVQGAYASNKVDVSGVVRTDYYGDAQKVSVSLARFNVYIPTATDTYYFVRVEPNRYNLDVEDEIKLAFVSHKNITVGLIPLNEGYCLPGPGDYRVVGWARIPFGVYGYGAQFTKKISTDSSMIFEVSGSPDGTVIKNNWDRAQISMRLAKGNDNITLRYDDNRNSQLLVNGERNISKFGTLFRGVLYSRHDAGKEKSGGYIFAEKFFGKKFALHLQSDFAQRSETLNTVGIRIIHGKSFAILDYEMKPSRNQMLASIVIPF